jgi:hypothetical protein
LKTKVAPNSRQNQKFALVDTRYSQSLARELKGLFGLRLKSKLLKAARATPDAPTLPHSHKENFARRKVVSSSFITKLKIGLEMNKTAVIAKRR